MKLCFVFFLLYSSHQKEVLLSMRNIILNLLTLYCYLVTLGEKNKRVFLSKIDFSIKAKGLSKLEFDTEGQVLF